MKQSTLSTILLATMILSFLLFSFGADKMLDIERQDKTTIDSLKRVIKAQDEINEWNNEYRVKDSLRHFRRFKMGIVD